MDKSTDFADFRAFAFKQAMAARVDGDTDRDNFWVWAHNLAFDASDRTDLRAHLRARDTFFPADKNRVDLALTATA